MGWQRNGDDGATEHKAQVHSSHTQQGDAQNPPGGALPAHDCELPEVQLDLERAEETEIKLPTLVGSRKNKRIPEKYLLLCHRLC